MPEISRFFGIVIAIYYKEHGVPHFHAKYAGQTGVFSIVDLKLVAGRLPRRVVALVLEWNGEAFEPLKNISSFKTVRVNSDLDTIVWENGADMSPDFLYEISVPVADSVPAA